MTACGSMRSYRRGCRCTPCRGANAARVRDNRAARLADPARLTHGTRSAYDAGCRCRECWLTRRDAYWIREGGNRPHRWRMLVTEAYRTAREAWQAGLDAAMHGASYGPGTRGRAGERWTDEERDYRARHRPPLFRDYLIGLSYAT